MKVLITGGAGFIGSHLAENLVEKGKEVFVIDDLSTGRLENIKHLKERKNFHYIIDSVLNRDILKKLIDECDQVYHLAAAVGVDLILRQPLKSLITNVEGTKLVLEYASQKRKKVLIASTSEVYGKSKKVPFQEDDDRVVGSSDKARWGYACSKALDEFLALAYFREKKLPVIIVRIFNTVGPRQTGRYGMVVPRFVRQALTGKALTIYGDGKQSRCFAYVDDVVEGMVQLMGEPGAIGQIFNIGSDEEISIEDLAKKIKKLTGSQSRLIYLPYKEVYNEGFEDIRRRVPDLTKISRIIGYKPKYDLKAILQKTIEHFKI